MKVFIDTSAFIALIVDKEILHKKTAQKYHDYRQLRATFFTSYYILDELFTRLLSYKDVDIKKQIKLLKDSISANEISVLQIDEVLFEKATATFLKFAEHRISLTDATTHVLYKDFGLDEIFTLDSDFKKMGLATSF